MKLVIYPRGKIDNLDIEAVYCLSLIIKKMI